MKIYLWFYSVWWKYGRLYILYFMEAEKGLFSTFIKTSIGFKKEILQQSSQFIWREVKLKFHEHIIAQIFILEVPNFLQDEELSLFKRIYDVVRESAWGTLKWHSFVFKYNATHSTNHDSAFNNLMKNILRKLLLFRDYFLHYWHIYNIIYRERHI